MCTKYSKNFLSLRWSFEKKRVIKNGPGFSTKSSIIWVYPLLLLVFNQRHGLVVRAFALEVGRLGSILSRVKPKTLKLVSAVTLAQQFSVARRMK